MGEENPPLVSRRQLWAWWLLSFANEPIVMAGLNLYMPVSLERLARSIGHLPDSPLEPCAATGVCILVGSRVTTEALAVYVSGVARMAGVLVFALIGALPDYGGWRHGILFGFTALGGGAALAWPLAAWPHLACLILAAILFVLVRVAQFVTVVIKSSYLPLLCHRHPLYEKAEGESGVDLLYNSLSTRNQVLGYLGGFCVLLAMDLMILMIPGQPTAAWRAAVGFCGAWWLLGSWFSWLHLPRFTGPPLPIGETVILFSLRRLLMAWSKIKRLPMAFGYLGISAFLTAAYQAMSACLILLGIVRLGIDQRLLILMGLTNPLLSVLGSCFFLQLQRLTLLPTRHILCLILGLLSVAPLWSVMGLFTNKVGMHHGWEYFVVQALFHFGLGALISSDRVMLAEMIPVHEANEFFALAGMTGRLAGALGSLLYGTIETRSGGQFRWAQLMIAILFIIPIPLLQLFIDQHRGKVHVEAYEQEAKAIMIEAE